MIKLKLHKGSRCTQKFLWVSLISVLTSCASQDVNNSKIILTGNDLSTWQKNDSEWYVCGSASMDPENEKFLTTSPGTGILVNGADGNTENLLSLEEFGDVSAHIEFMVPRGSNSGIYFMGRYEIQVLDSWGKQDVNYNDAGGIYERWDEDREPKGYEGVGPRVNVSKKPGEWQEFDVIFQSPRFDQEGKKISNAKFIKVVFNGTVIHDNIEVTGPTRAATFEHEPESAKGPLMLQGDHGPVAYRNIQITRK
jgi:hypothetical protein